MPLPIIALATSAMVVANFLQNALHIYPPLWNAWQKTAWSAFPNLNPQIAELVEMRWRGVIPEADYFKKCSQFGFNQDTAKDLFSISETLLTMHDYIALWRRGAISESDCDSHLHKMHLDSGEIEKAKTITLFFPSPPDLIRFAVREVYTPSIIEKFGAMQDLPAKYLQEAAKTGLTDEHAKNYWAAHWELPSAQMGFQMLHRRIIDEDSLKLLLRALDVMPFWRDALVKLSYNPLTRVDVRRMYRLGVLNEEQVTEAYLDRGYNPKNAELMTQFTVAFEADEMTGITRASVLSSFKKGIITEDQLKTYLKGFGYNPNVIEFWLSIARYDKEMDIIDSLVDEIKQRYTMGLVTLDGAREELAQYDLPASFVSEVITRLQIKQSQKIKLPSRSDLEAWLKLQIINDIEYSARMMQLGYTENDIEMYLSEITVEIDTSSKRFLSQKTYERWFQKQIIGEERFRAIMVDLKTRPEDIERLVQELTPQAEL